MEHENVDKDDWVRYQSQQQRKAEITSAPSENQVCCSPINSESEVLTKGYTNDVLSRQSSRSENHVGLQNISENNTSWPNKRWNEATLTSPKPENLWNTTGAEYSTKSYKTGIQSELSLEHSISELSLHKGETSQAPKALVTESKRKPNDQIKSSNRAPIQKLPTRQRPKSTAIDFDDDDFQDEDFVQEQILFHQERAYAALQSQDHKEHENHLNVLIAELPGPHLLGSKIDMAYIQLSRAAPQEALDLFQDFKYDPGSEPDLNLAAYYTRAIAAYTLQRYQSTFTDCKRGIALYNKLPPEDKADPKTYRVRYGLTDLASHACVQLNKPAESSFYAHLAAEMKAEALGLTDAQIPVRERYPKLIWDPSSILSAPVQSPGFKDTAEYVADNTTEETPQLTAKEATVDGFPKVALIDPSRLLELSAFKLLSKSLSIYGIKIVIAGNPKAVYLSDSFVPSEKCDPSVFRSLNSDKKSVMMTVFKSLLEMRQVAQVEALHILCQIHLVATIKKTTVSGLAKADRILGISPEPATPLQLLVYSQAYEPYAKEKRDYSDQCVELAKSLVQYGADVDELDNSNSYTALSIAALTGQFGMMETLIGLGAKFDQPSFGPEVFSPFRCSIFRAGRSIPSNADYGGVDMFPFFYLVGLGAQKLYTDSTGVNNLHFATLTADRPEVIDALLSDWPTKEFRAHMIYNKACIEGFGDRAMHLTPYGILVERGKSKQHLREVFENRNVFA